MAKELIINATLPEVRIALMDDGRIQELLIERDSEKGIVGNIYKGRVTRVLPGMQAAFVDVGLDKAAFLYVDDIYVHPRVMGEETEFSPDDGEEADGEEADVETPEAEGRDSQARADLTGFDPAGGASAEGLEASAVELQPESPSESPVEASQAANLETDLESDQEMPADEDFEEDLDEDEVGEDDFESADDSAEELAEDAAREESLADDQGAEQEAEQEAEQAEGSEGSLQGLQGQGQRRGRRGRNRNRRRRRGGGETRHSFAGGESHEDPNLIPQSVNESLNDSGSVESDRAAVAGETAGLQPGAQSGASKGAKRARPEFREQRGRDRRIKAKALRPRAQANISDLLKEGQEVIVQVAKDPIATKGARLTCHVSLPGRHLVCMPSIDHVGVSRRIEREDERRRLRDFVERNRPRKMGFIVRTASGGKDPESWIKQDIDYLSKLWTGIRTKADEVSAPSLVYEDLTSILRAIRDWVNEDIDRIVVDTRYHYNELVEFAERFMPTLIEKIELYQGDIPIFDAYGLSSELTRSMERKVWLKSGGYIVIDQAEALVAVDVNTGRFVGKKNLEDTILKTNLEAAEEIAYQLRLRNCGGIIIVDFIDMERDDNKMRVYRALDEALKKDRARPTIQKISELGLVEMTRKRTRDTLVRTLCEPCAHCEGRGYTKTHATVAYEILREVERLCVDRDAKKVLVSAHDSVINVLAIELRDALDQIERRYNKSVYLQAILDFHGEQFEVVSDRAQGKKPNVDIARQLRIERERSERSERKERGRQRNQQDRNQGGGRHSESRQESRHESRNESRQENRNQEPRNQEPREAPKAPVARPSGSFIAPPKPAQAPASAQGAQPVSGAQTAAPATGEDEDRQPDFNAAPTRSREQAPDQSREQSNDQGRDQGEDFNDMDDEDQLAYLRAQAAQDAAIAGLGSPSGSNQGGRNQRGQNFRNQQNQGGGRGGRHQQQQQQRHRHGQQRHQDRNQQRGGRYRPQQGGGNGGGNNGNANGNLVAQNMDARPRSQQHTEQVVVPDYEVLNRQGDGSES